MKKLSTAALAALLGTTLLPATAIGFQEVNTNPAAVGLDDETTNSQDEDPFTDAGAEVDDADTILTDNPEQTDVTVPMNVVKEAAPYDMTGGGIQTGDIVDDDDPGVPGRDAMSHMDSIEDDVESSDSIETVEAGSPAGSDSEASDSGSGILENKTPDAIDDDVHINYINNSGDVSNDLPQPVTDPRIVDAPAAVAMPTVDPDPTVEEENDEAVPGSGDMEEQMDEMNAEEGGS